MKNRIKLISRRMNKVIIISSITLYLLFYLIFPPMQPSFLIRMIVPTMLTFTVYFGFIISTIIFKESKYNVIFSTIALISYLVYFILWMREIGGSSVRLTIMLIIFLLIGAIISSLIILLFTRVIWKDNYYTPLTTDKVARRMIKSLNGVGCTIDKLYLALDKYGIMNQGDNLDVIIEAYSVSKTPSDELINSCDEIASRITELGELEDLGIDKSGEIQASEILKKLK